MAPFVSFAAVNRHNAVKDTVLIRMTEYHCLSPVLSRQMRENGETGRSDTTIFAGRSSPNMDFYLFTGELV